MSQELIDLILHGREERNLEYAGCCAWDASNIKAKITKTVLAISNIPDGGAIVVGVEQQGSEFKLTGLSEGQRDSFKHDHVAAHVNEYADPFAEILVTPLPFEIENQERHFVVIQVQEFSEIPVICKKDGGRNLRRGAIYTRTRRIHETAEVPGQAEMREILHLASEKGIRSLYSRIGRAGLQVENREQRDRKQFDEQLGDL